MTIRVMPKGLEVNLDKLKKKIIEKLKEVVEGEVGFKKQPIAFGLNALDLTLIVPEDKGSLVEETLSGIKGVQTVNVQSVSLV
ncbi:elongation factor 1-beta [archaeon]|nr:elongation factor 1-beta [archaeon]